MIILLRCWRHGELRAGVRDYLSRECLVLMRRTNTSFYFKLIAAMEVSEHKEGTIGCRRLVIRLTASGAKAELRLTTDIT